MGWKQRNKSFFMARKSNVENRVKKTYIDHDMAVIPCRVEDYYDIINRYSVPGLESLNPEFCAYLDDTINYIPAEYPLVVEITGKKFSLEEQERIRDTILTDSAYNLSDAEEEVRYYRRLFLYVLLGTILSTGLILLAQNLTDVAAEFFYVIYWFFADTLVRFLLQDRFELREKRLLAGRKASLTVRFYEKFDDSSYTDTEAKELVNEILSQGN